MKCKKCGIEITNEYTLCNVCRKKPYSIDQFKYFSPAPNNKHIRIGITWKEIIIFFCSIIYIVGNITILYNTTLSTKFYIAQYNFYCNKYGLAAKQFKDLVDYRNSRYMRNKCHLCIAQIYLDNQYYIESLAALDLVPDFENSTELKNIANYYLGVKYINDGNFSLAIKHLRETGKIMNSEVLLNQAKLKIITQYNNGDISADGLLKIFLEED